MIRFVFVRLLTGVLVLFLVTVAVFALFFAAPNNVARTLAGKMASQTTINMINTRLGLDQPLWVQYGKFVGHALKGDLGFDYYHDVPVTTIIGQAAPISLSVALGAAVLWLVLGIVSGVISAVRPRSLIDRAVNVFALIFYSMPSFLLGLLLLYFLYYRLTKAGHVWFPPSGYVPMSAGLDQWAKHLILPWVSLALLTAASYTRFTRASMIEVLGEDYIRTARAKGLSERRIIYRHALRSALTPVVTQFGIDLGVLAGGALVTEQVFSLQGMGWNAVQAVRNQDLPVILGVVIIASTAVVVANFLVDVLYAVLDPRVRVH